jgi:predicted nucleic acid-binding Zn ribbon protein
MIMQIGKKFCSSEVREIMARKRNEKKLKIVLVVTIAM